MRVLDTLVQNDQGTYWCLKQTKTWSIVKSVRTHNIEEYRLYAPCFLMWRYDCRNFKGGETTLYINLSGINLSTGVIRWRKAKFHILIFSSISKLKFLKIKLLSHVLKFLNVHPIVLTASSKPLNFSVQTYYQKKRLEISSQTWNNNFQLPCHFDIRVC